MRTRWIWQLISPWTPTPHSSHLRPFLHHLSPPWRPVLAFHRWNPIHHRIAYLSTVMWRQQRIVPGVPQLKPRPRSPSTSIWTPPYNRHIIAVFHPPARKCSYWPSQISLRFPWLWILPTRRRLRIPVPLVARVWVRGSHPGKDP